MGSLAITLGVLAFVGALITSRRMKERAFTALDEDQKLRVLDAFGGLRITQLVPIAALVLLYLGVSLVGQGSSDAVIAVFWLGLLLYGVLSVTLQLLRLRQLDLPPAYARSWLVGRLMVFGSMVLMILGFWLGGVR